MIGGFLRHLGISAAKSTIITDPRDLAAALEDVGVESAAGLVVSPQVAVMVSAVSAAVSLLAESIAQLPIHVYERQEKGKDRREGDPLAILLHDRPNTYQTPFEFFELMTLWLLLWGNCYAIVVKTRGAASELIPVHPDRVEVQLDANHRRVYLVSEKDGVQRTYGQESVLHVMDRSFDGLKGRSRLKDGRDTIGLSKAAETWGARLFKNSARPAGLLTSPEKLNAEQMSRLRESWKKAHGGENALGTAVLDAGMEWKPLVMNNRDAQFTESRKFQIAEIARLYRVPPHMVGDLERATFSNIEQQSLEFLKYSLMPWIKRWEGALNRALIPVGDKRFVAFLVDGFLRGAIKERYDAYAVALQSGFMTVNEIRERENLNPHDGHDDLRQAESVFGGDDGKARQDDSPAPTKSDD